MRTASRSSPRLKRPSSTWSGGGRSARTIPGCATYAAVELNANGVPAWADLQPIEL